MSDCHKYLFLLLLFCIMQQIVAQPFPKIDSSTHTTMRATFYSDRFVGRKTSSGERFYQDKFTAAHRSYKFGTLLLVTNPKNGRQVIVRVNDRCPKANILDMTRRAASMINIKSSIVTVHVLPESYLPLWEEQERFSELLEEGLFLEFASRGIKSIDELVGDRSLYDIRLFCAKSADEAERQTSHLPIFYQDKLTIRQDDGNCPLSVILEISSSRIKAEVVLRELQAIFPSAKIVKAK